MPTRWAATNSDRVIACAALGISCANSYHVRCVTDLSAVPERGTPMRHHRSILAALVVSLLLVGSSIAAPRRVSTQFFMYLPHIDTSAPCTVSWPPEVPLVLPAFILAFLDAGDIWLFHPTTRSVERLTQD